MSRQFGPGSNERTAPSRSVEFRRGEPDSLPPTFRQAPSLPSYSDTRSKGSHALRNGIILAVTLPIVVPLLFIGYFFSLSHWSQLMKN